MHVINGQYYDTATLNPMIIIPKEYFEYHNTRNTILLVCNINIIISLFFPISVTYQVVSREAKKKQAVHNKRVSYLHVALL